MPYYSVRSLLTLDNDLLFKDNQLFIPSSMRDGMKECAHKSHGGIGACLRRMRECIFWPGMSKNMINASQPARFVCHMQIVK